MVASRLMRILALLLPYTYFLTSSYPTQKNGKIYHNTFAAIIVSNNHILIKLNKYCYA